MKYGKGSLGQRSLWTRPLLGRDESDFEELVTVLENLTLTNEEDKLIRLPGPGKFSRKKCKDIIQNGSQPRFPIWRKIWKSKLPPKVIIFLWKLC